MTDHTAEDTFEALKRIPFNADNVNESSFEVEDVSISDYPDFCDAFIGYAEYNNGTVVPDEDMEQLNEAFDDLINNLAHDHCF